MAIDTNTTDKEKAASQEHANDMASSPDALEQPEQPPAAWKGKDQHSEGAYMVPVVFVTVPTTVNNPLEKSSDAVWVPYPRQDESEYYCRGSQKAERCCWMSCFAVAPFLFIVFIASTVVAKIFMTEYDTTAAAVLSMGSITKRSYQTQQCTGGNTKGSPWHCDHVTKCCKCSFSIRYEYYANRNRYVGKDYVESMGKNFWGDANTIKTKIFAKERISISYDPDRPSMRYYEDEPIGSFRFAALVGGIGGGYLVDLHKVFSLFSQPMGGPDTAKGKSLISTWGT
mmetsp:Transcript_18236/g.36704  ORF Transcript_18236/g.36704 Transcript_18236/m.36704 type:complete len:284 (+) Transcript_18236:242-1093(+)|eukprot:scaffold1140_cov157-Amphora_coffeaeformis.AAC.18